MKYFATFEHIRQEYPAYTLGIEAADYNEACRLAKQAAGPDEEIISIELDAADLFAGILNRIGTGFKLTNNDINF